MISPFSYITIPAFAVTHLKLNGNRMENTWPVKKEECMTIFDPRDYIVPRFAIEEYGLKGNELLVYSFLFTYTDEGKGRVCCTTEDFEEATNISRRSVSNVLDSLKQKGLIKNEKFILYDREHFGYSVKTPKNYKEFENGK